MGQLSFKEAKELSIAKWTLIVENGGSEEGLLYPVFIRSLPGKCGFCQRHLPYSGPDDCGNCELKARTGFTCYESSSLYFRWRYSLIPEQSLALATEMLETIESL